MAALYGQAMASPLVASSGCSLQAGGVPTDPPRSFKILNHQNQLKLTSAGAEHAGDPQIMLERL